MMIRVMFVLLILLQQLAISGDVNDLRPSNGIGSPSAIDPNIDKTLFYSQFLGELRDHNVPVTMVIIDIDRMSSDSPDWAIYVDIHSGCRFFVMYGQDRNVISVTQLPTIIGFVSESSR